MLDETNQKLIKIILAYLAWFVLLHIVIELIKQTFTAINIGLLEYNLIFGLNRNTIELIFLFTNQLSIIILVGFVSYYILKLTKKLHKELEI